MTRYPKTASFSGLAPGSPPPVPLPPAPLTRSFAKPALPLSLTSLAALSHTSRTRSAVLEMLQAVGVLDRVRLKTEPATGAAGAGASVSSGSSSSKLHLDKLEPKLFVMAHFAKGKAGVGGGALNIKQIQETTMQQRQ